MIDPLEQSADGRNPFHVKGTPREMVFQYLPYLPWLIASIAICLGLAYLKLRYAPQVYSVSGSILIKDPTAAGARQDKIEEMLFVSPNKNINDEIQVIRSRKMGERVVKVLGLEVQYFNEGKIKTSIMSADESPVRLNIQHLNDSLMPFNLTLTALNDTQFRMGTTVVEFGKVFETASGRFSVTWTAPQPGQFASANFVISYAPADQRAQQLTNHLSAAPSGESNNILKLDYETENTRMGESIVNTWMREYQHAGLEDKRQAAENTLSFINDQLKTSSKELSEAERNLQGFRERNKIINPEQQSEKMFTAITEVDRELTKQQVQMRVVNNLIDYIADTKNPYRQVASALGIDEPGLGMQIVTFNKLQVERETLLKSTTRSNPLVVNTEASIEKLREDILQNLRNVRDAYAVSINNLNSRTKLADQEIATMPAKEKELLEYTRKQKILEQLFSFLLQKQLETNISSASAISNVRVIESAKASDGPVKPNRSGTYIIALFLGAAIPSLIVFLKEYLNDKVKGRQDVARVTEAPIIGEVSHSDEAKTLVVSRDSRRFIAEQFRIIRTNLQYVLPSQDKAVILVTSSTSGEGKSFISTNIAMALALTGKKTAILELDIRKPKVMSGLGMAKKSGITNYIIGKAEFHELPVKVPNVENLWVIPCGPIPPNPSELLLNERMSELMDKLKEEFEMIVIDTAPVGLVSDAVVLGRFADASLYVVRHDYTFRKQLQMLDEMYTNQRLPRMSLVLNDIKTQGGYGRYYGYGGYGYTGYGYGYGTEYFDEKRKSFDIVEKFRKLIRPKR